MSTGYNDPKTQAPPSETARRRATARRRIPALIEDIRRDNREAESGFSRCRSLEEQLYHELRNLHRGRRPWRTELPVFAGEVSPRLREQALSELENFQELSRQRAYQLAAILLASPVPAAA